MKRLLLVLMLILGAVMITSRPVATYAYTDEEKQQAKSWLSSHGYPPTRAGAEQAYQDYMDGKIDVPEADAVLILCTGVRSVPIIEMLEKDLKKPVISAIQASMWYSLKTLGIDTNEVKGFGSLFEK